MHHYLGKVLWGIAFLTAGIILGGNALGYWSMTVFFEGWWTLFIIIPCLYNMYESGIHTANLIGLGLGVLFLAGSLELLPRGLVSNLVFPFILVIIGGRILFDGFSKKD